LSSILLSPGDRRGGVIPAAARCGAALLAAALLALGTAHGAAGGGASCLGRTPTITGTGSGDTLTGTSGQDVIAGLGGDDVIRGRGGRDRICGGQGQDALIGEAGKDRLSGQPGGDVLRGGAGADVLLGGPGVDACYPGDAAGSESSCEPLAAEVCTTPGNLLRRTALGTYPNRSGDIQVIANAPDFMGSQTSHSGSWDYLQHVPMFLYGPGYIESQPPVDRPVTMASLAPTVADLVGHGFEGAKPPLHEALVPEGERPGPPKLVVTLVWDSAGRNVLARWPGQWSMLKNLKPDGTWYDRAFVGSSPSDTPPIHATMGTGVYPSTHGIVDITQTVGGQMKSSFASGPKLLEAPTLGDVYDPSTGNDALVGAVASIPGHLGMIGHGSFRENGDADVAVLKSRQPGAWWGLSPGLKRYYRFPPYVQDVKGFSKDKHRLDARDGKLDGRWRDNNIEALDGGFDTPARLWFETRVIEKVIRQEGFGDDAVTDLLYLNYKVIDVVGHKFTMNSKEMKDSLAIQDKELGVLMDLLDEVVGAGDWVLALTADHASQPKPSVSGANVFSMPRMRDLLTARFDAPGGPALIMAVRPTQVFLRETALKPGTSLAEVARFVSRLKVKALVEGSVPAGEAGRRAFDAALPATWLDQLGCVPDP
jgi:Type I phosphodiesterase / nucleotide pyrophosphatase/RTX calcium-binding nonapeptide repeat (4 copies)